MFKIIIIITISNAFLFAQMKTRHTRNLFLSQASWFPFQSPLRRKEAIRSEATAPSRTSSTPSFIASLNRTRMQAKDRHDPRDKVAVIQASRSSFEPQPSQKTLQVSRTQASKSNLEAKVSYSRPQVSRPLVSKSHFESHVSST